MRYKGCMSLIKGITDNYGAFIRDQVAEYEDKHNKIDAEIEANKDDWTDNYKERYKKEHSPDRYLSKRIKERQQEALNEVIPLLDKMEGNIKKAFGGDVSDGFKNKMLTFTAVGVELSEPEIKILADGCTSYAELRTLQAYVQKMATDKQATIKAEGNADKYIKGDKTDNAADRQAFDVGAALNYMHLPDAGVVLNQMERFRHNTIQYIENYSGDHGEMAGVCSNADKMDAVTTAQYPHYAEGVYKDFEAAADELPKGLTSEEIATIDNTFKHTLSGDIKRAVMVYADDNPELKELLEQDSRYNGYLDS